MSLDREKVFAYIDSRRNDHVAKLQDLVRQPSISLENRGIKECAELVEDYLKTLGCQTGIVPTSGNPVVFGKYDAKAERTVLVYLMYDTMPVDEPGWVVPPLEGNLVDTPPFGKCLVARGAYNTKGELRAFLNACESIRATGQELPVNLLFVAEGEEELGSRHLPEFINSHMDELKQADLVFFPIANQDRTGKVTMWLGVKGIVYFELELDGKDWGLGPTEFGIHGSNKAWVDSPVWRMIQALSTMTSPDGNRVLIDGFYENVVGPNEDDIQLLHDLQKTFQEDPFMEEAKVQRFISDKHGIDAFKMYLFDPTLNINGIWGGYTGPETKTLLPHKVTAKVDVRLVPNMTPEEVIPRIRKHLDSKGFLEVKIRLLESGYSWAKTTPKHPAAQAMIRSYRELGKEPEVWPTLGGSAPFSMFNGPPLNLPFVMGGLGHGARAHSPNEYLVIDEGGPTGGLASMEKSYVVMMQQFGSLHVD